MAARFAEWERRHPPAGSAGDASNAPWTRATLARVWARAVRLETDVCRAAGVEPPDVRRLRWTGPLLLRANLIDDQAAG